MPIKITTIPTGLLSVNTVIIHEDTVNEAVIIDPGGDVDLLYDFLKQNQLSLSAIIHTHAHFDHIEGTPALFERYPDLRQGTGVYLHPEDQYLWENLEFQGRQFGLSLRKQNAKITDWLEAGRPLNFKKFSLDVLHTPGHSPGSCTFFLNHEQGCLVSGDVIFQGSIGRTDLWKGNFEELMQSINEKILVYPDATRIISGHGPDTTVAHEKASNPFLEH